jgi:D-lyxose ketol-isomerase
MTTRIDQVGEIRVREKTAPVLTYKLTSFRNVTAQDTAVNITGYAFRLRVWRFYLDAEKERQRETKFELDGAIVSASAGTFKFTLTAAKHTGLPPGEYFAEIFWNSAGDLDVAPTDGVRVRYIVEAGGG